MATAKQDCFGGFVFVYVLSTFNLKFKEFYNLDLQTFDIMTL